MRHAGATLALAMRVTPLAAASLAIAAGCSAEQEPEPGQVVVAMTTNMVPGVDFDEVSLLTKRDDASATFQPGWRYAWSEGGNPPRFPATFSLVNRTSGSPLLTVRLEAKQRGRLRIVRDALVALPSSGRLVLPMLLDWSCLDRIPVRTPTDLQCAEGQTCVGGVCATPTQEPSLTPFEPGQVFGGGTGAGGSGSCFDVLGTFDGCTTYLADRSQGRCGIAWSGSDANLNVAVALPAGSEGFCYTSGSGGCFVPLEKGATGGWALESGRLVVPDRSCAVGARIAVVSGKPTKSANEPPCGAFSSAGADAGTGPTATIIVTEADAGMTSRDAATVVDATPDTSTPDASTPDASTPDASTPDASTPDAPTPDASTPDASAPDASAPDAAIRDVACVGESDVQLIAAACDIDSCGSRTVTDACGRARTISCPSTCNVPPSDDCADGLSRRTYAAMGVCTGGRCTYAPTVIACNAASCSGAQATAAGTCSAGVCRAGATTTCPNGCAGTVCSGCAPESNATFCGRVGANCGSRTAADNCGTVRTVDCGTCSGTGATCGGGGTANVCGCTPQTDAQLCGSRNCGTFTTTDNCGQVRNALCGSCQGVNTCGGGGVANVCGCSETDAALCTRLGKTCGALAATDACGMSRNVASCGTCSGTGVTCGGGGTANVCGCTPQTNAEFCGSRNCGTVTGSDNCGQTRTVSCGTCSAGSSCSASNTCDRDVSATSAGFTGVGLSDCGPSSNDVCARSLRVAGGAFLRQNSSASPATVSTFRLDKYEVTVGRFRKFVEARLAGWSPTAGSGKHTHLNGGSGLVNPSGGNEIGWSTTWTSYLGAPTASVVAPTGPGATTKAEWDANLNCSGAYATWTSAAGANEKKPMTCLSWYDAYAFCMWDGGFLPSEAEYEYAAAGGSEQRMYAWGTTVPSSNTDLAIYGCYYNGTGASSCTGSANIAPVGIVTAGAGKWGHLDLGGNVNEWSFDWHQNTFPTPCTDCANATNASFRVLRGGSYFGAVETLPTGARTLAAPAVRSITNGARCARTP